jgi:hypothetical protein
MSPRIYIVGLTSSPQQARDRWHLEIVLVKEAFVRELDAQSAATRCSVLLINGWKDSAFVLVIPGHVAQSNTSGMKTGNESQFLSGRGFQSPKVIAPG